MEPSATARRRTRLYSALGSGALVGGASAYVGLVDPHNPRAVFPACPFKLLTGWNCPACGGLRMMHDVLHGDLAAATNDNLFLLVGIPALLTWFLVRWRLGRPLMPTSTAVIVVIAAITWTVVRNLPEFPLVPILLDR